MVELWPAQTAVRQFEVLLQPDVEDGGFTVWCPQLRGCISEGETREEALANIREAIELWLEGSDPIENPILERETVTVEILESAPSNA
jgi:predicted RNase H-like HicB family nuclease